MARRSVAGRVIDANTGRAIGGARIGVGEGGAAAGDARLPSAQSGRDGDFIVRGLAPGWRTLMVSSRGYNAEVALIPRRGPMLIVLHRRSQGRPEKVVCGIGVRLVPSPAGRGLEVSAVHARTPASEAGLKAGDVLREIDGRRVGALRLAAERLRGASGTVVAIRLGDGRRLVLRRRLFSGLLE